MSDAAGSVPSSAPSAPTSSPSKAGGAPSTPAAKPAATGASTGATAASKAPATGATPAAPAPRKLSDQVAKKPAAPANETPAERAERKELEKRKYQFKVDGREWDEELDDNEIRVRLQKGFAADKRMQEAAELRKKFQDAMSYGKDNLDEAVKQLFGVDIDEYMEQRLESRFKDAMLSEEERERSSLQKELERYKKQEQEAKTRAEQEARQKFEREIWENTEKEFIGALDRLGYDRNVSKLLLPMMTDLADAALDAGMELDAELIAHEANKRLSAVNKTRLTGLKGDRLLAELGDDVVKEVLKARLSKARLTPEPEPPPPPAPVARPRVVDVREKPQKSGMSSSQFRRKHIFGG